MTATAKLFQNGQSQAVRLPKEFRFNGENEVDITRVGDYVLLSPHKTNKWTAMFEAVNEFSDDFTMTIDRPRPENREALFQ